MRKLVLLLISVFFFSSIAKAGVVELKCSQVRDDLNFLFCSHNDIQYVFLVQPAVEENELQCRVQKNSSVIECNKKHQMIKINGKQINLKLEVIQ